jgi:hypothetical protein
LALAFFGLTPNDKQIFLEPTFTLMYYMGFTYGECINLPVWQREWFIERLVKEMDRANGQSRAAHSNDAASRAMSGHHRDQTPAKLRRFT